MKTIETNVHELATSFVDAPIFNQPLRVRDVLEAMRNHPELMSHLRGVSSMRLQKFY